MPTSSCGALRSTWMAPEPSASSAYSDDGWYPDMDPDLTAITESP
jgi:hypothetical protein